MPFLNVLTYSAPLRCNPLVMRCLIDLTSLVDPFYKVLGMILNFKDENLNNLLIELYSFLNFVLKFVYT